MRRVSQVGCSCLLLLALAVAGCSDAKVPKYPVHGRVLDRDGKPAVGALIVLTPVAGDSKVRPTARVEESGEFKVTTDTAGDGAPAGEFAVTILWPTPKKAPFDPDGPDQLGGAYADVKNPKVKVTVEKKEVNQIPDIKLP